MLATDTPEYISPATSVVVQHRLGAKRAGTFDLNCACAGFVTALDTASKYIIADTSYKNVLVIGAYAMSKFVDWTEKKTATIFADGAGAVVLQAVADAPGFLASKLVADGSFHDHMGIYAGGTRMPITEEVLREGVWAKLRFAKKYPSEVNTEGWPAIVRDVLREVRPDSGRRGALSLHAGQPEHDQRGHGEARSADVAHAHGHGQVGLHRLGLHPDGAGRRRRERAS